MNRFVACQLEDDYTLGHYGISRNLSNSGASASTSARTWPRSW